MVEVTETNVFICRGVKLFTSSRTIPSPKVNKPIVKRTFKYFNEEINNNQLLIMTILKVTFLHKCTKVVRQNVIF